MEICMTEEEFEEIYLEVQDAERMQQEDELKPLKAEWPFKESTNEK